MHLYIGLKIKNLKFKYIHTTLFIYNINEFNIKGIILGFKSR